MIVKILLHAVYKELPRFWEIKLDFMDYRIRQEVSIDSMYYSLLSRRSTAISQKVLMKIFLNLFRKISQLKLKSKTNDL